jgi:hypothetical protein
MRGRGRGKGREGRRGKGGGIAEEDAAGMVECRENGDMVEESHRNGTDAHHKNTTARFAAAAQGTSILARLNTLRESIIESFPFASPVI